MAKAFSRSSQAVRANLTNPSKPHANRFWPRSPFRTWRTRRRTPLFRPAFTAETASYNKFLLVSRTSALGERHIEKSTFLMLVRQRSAKKSRQRATSQVECAAPRRRPGLPRTPRPFLPVGPSPPRFWGLAAPRGATRGNRINSSRLASGSNSTLGSLVSYTTLARANRGCAKIVPFGVPIAAKTELRSAFVHAHCARPIRVSTSSHTIAHREHPSARAQICTHRCAPPSS